ncbi:MAG: hypothetical protein ACI9ON_002680 [Limisphaerales bacterium]|jgi:hypothetical protein
MMVLSLRQTRQNDPAEWFLISGDLCIRLTRPVTIGVDANGTLQLNAKQVITGRWLTLEVAPDANSVAINWLDESLELRNAEPQQAEPVLTQGTLLRLPHNEVYLGRSMQRGKRSQLIEVVQRRNVTTPAPQPAKKIQEPIEPIEPISEAMPELEPTTKTRSTIERAQAAQLPLLPLSEAISVVVPSPMWTASNEPVTHASRPPKPPATERDHSWLWGTLAVGGIAVILYQLYIPSTQQEPASISLQAPTITEKVTTTNELAVEIATSTPNEETVDTPVLVTPPVGVDQTSVLPTSISLIKTDKIPSDINPESLMPDSLMNEAQALFDMGYYTWPKPSAADTLDDLLALDPAHNDALALRDRMASLLIDKARQSYTEGLFGSARDQIKAVLAFHRNHGPAVELLIKWDEARLNRNLNRERLPSG